jgi:hypothetical protein
MPHSSHPCICVRHYPSIHPPTNWDGYLPRTFGGDLSNPQIGDAMRNILLAFLANLQAQSASASISLFQNASDVTHLMIFGLGVLAVILIAQAFS